MGPPTATLSRIVLQYCVDAVPMWARKNAGSAKPCQQVILSLPPWLRYSVHNMLLQMLIPATLKGQQAKKYYDFAAAYEINDLYRSGIDGVRVIVYGTSLDTPGRRELLSLTTVGSFYGCAMCQHHWQSGLRGLCKGGYRRFLPMGSSWRQRQFRSGLHTYMFRDIETRPPPLPRTDASMCRHMRLATADKPFRGHKVVAPFLHRWLGFTWSGNFGEVMHDFKVTTEMILKTLVGKVKTGSLYKGWKKDEDHRDDCEAFNVFPQVLYDHRVRLSQRH